MTNLKSKSAKCAVAFAAIYLIWGSTFLAIRFSIATIPPFFMMGFRCLVAGGVLYAWSRLRGANPPQPAQWLTALIVGILLFTVGHGALAWSEQFLPSGIAALICATSPIWITLLQTVFHRDHPLTSRVVFGLIMGVFGVALLIEPSTLLNGATLDPIGAVILLAGTLSWSIGVVYSKRANLPENAILAAGMNLLTGGGGLLFASLFKEKVTLTSISLQSLVSLGYLIVFGSIITFSAYFWLLRVTSPSRVATHSFVNPLVAIFVGWFAGGELIHPRILIAALMMVIGVGAIVRNQNHKYKFFRAKEPNTGGHMIARIWIGKTLDSTSDEYFNYLEKTGIKDTSSTEGNRGVYVLRREEDGISEFLFITLWDSMEAIRKFAGQDTEKAVYYPDDKKYLIESKQHVKHFEVLLASKGGNSYNEGSLSRLMKYARGIKI